MKGHLEYYLEHGLNPVHYEMADLARHLQRRASLYRILGIHPRLIAGARVLEVAAGTGQNSLHLAASRPRELVLVEPNPVARKEIVALYESMPALLRPQLLECRLQEYTNDDPFDLVVCENWLGRSPDERALLAKLGGMVAPSGILVVTTVSPTGILPNILRRALAHRIAPLAAPFAERTAILVSAFGPHLATLPAMTRTATDWVQDNMLNPAYFGVILTLQMVLETLAGKFEVLDSCPRFATDWRWFKGLHGAARDFNGHFLAEYRACLHDFLDHRAARSLRDPARNDALESAAWSVIDAVAAQESRGTDRDAALNDALLRLQAETVDLPAATRSALLECSDLLSKPSITPEQVAGMQTFSALFGRETVYLSLERVS